MTGLATAFAYFGAAGKNPRWSWSARTDDGETVVMTLWKDLLDYSTKPLRYNTFARRDREKWLDNPGNRERLENLIWAREKCGGEFRVVIIEAEDTKAYPRKIRESFAQPRMLGRIVELDRDTGELEAEIVSGGDFA